MRRLQFLTEAPVDLHQHVEQLPNKVTLQEISGGRYVLTGWDMYTEDLSAVLDDSYKEYEHCRSCSFVLDGLTFTAVEDPQDGYRSSMGYLFWSHTPTRITFPPVPVFAKLSSNPDEEGLLLLIDAVSGLTVLSVGTDNSDNWYPSFVAQAIPQHMYFNFTGVSAAMLMGTWDELCAAATANWKSAALAGKAKLQEPMLNLDPHKLLK